MPEKEKKHGIFNMLFSPRLGESVSPVLDLGRLFANLIARIFISCHLLKADDPVFTDENMQSFGLMTILNGAAKNLKFDREHLPQTLMYFAVVLGLICGAFAILIITLSLLSRQAHAGVDTGAFTTSNSQDLAQQWLSYLFLGKPLNVTDQNGIGIPAGFDVQKSLFAALGYYSNAILIVAAVILFYHLSAMVVETAHHGEAMGKRANQIWAPIRLVVAIGLLVPINGGLNTGQMIVVKMSQWGSALGSNVWGVFLKSMSGYNAAMTAPEPDPTQVFSIVRDMLMIKACESDYNYIVGKQNAAYTGTSYSAGRGRTVTTDASLVSGVSVVEKKNYRMGSISGTKYLYNGTALSDINICGWYFVPNLVSNPKSGSPIIKSADANLSAMSASVFNVETQAFLKMVGQLQPLADYIVSLNPVYWDPSASATGAAVPVTGATVPPYTGPSLEEIADKYEEELVTKMAPLAQTNSTNISDVLSGIEPYGWLYAGAFLNTIERIQGGISSMAGAGMPNIHPPDMLSESMNPDIVPGLYDGVARDRYARRAKQTTEWTIANKVGVDLKNYSKYLSGMDDTATAGSSGDAQCMAMINLSNPATKSGDETYIDMLFRAIDWLASFDGVWQSNDTTTKCKGGPANGQNKFALGIQLTGQDPFSQLSALGHANLDVAFYLLEWAAGFQIAGGALSGGGDFIKSAGSLLGAASSVLMIFVLVFFVAGFALAYLLPLFPFFRFFLAVLVWIGAIFEAIVAMPLVALAHLNPEPDGLAGDAKNAYYFLFNIMLRPVLIILGLVIGIIIFFIAVCMFNATFNIAVAGAGGTSNHAVLSKIIYSILYVFILYLTANHAFGMIDHLPNSMLRWMGIDGIPHQSFGKLDDFRNAAVVIESVVTKQALDKVSRTSQEIGQIAGANMGIRKEDKKEDKTAKLIKHMKDNNMLPPDF